MPPEEIISVPHHNRLKEILRLRIDIEGAVQGVGFRPFVYRLAESLGLRGWIKNSLNGVTIEVEGDKPALEDFLISLERKKPANTLITGLDYNFLAPAGYDAFRILESNQGKEKSALILPDIATCPQCLEEIFSPRNRRYLYPFTNCTHCGPRFSIVESVPYDRRNTTMRHFTMCPRCEREYTDPSNRRFHAQPNACPECGPRIKLWDHNGKILFGENEAVLNAVDALLKGAIVAVKGLGGFHLFADAVNGKSVQKLRARKHREEKPFAVMMESLEMVGKYCVFSKEEEELLCSPAAPIVLLRKKDSSFPVSENVAPENPYLGVMLAYTPLHHILMRHLKRPAVATSGNLSDEPICTDENEARERLKGIADFFLVHNRPIFRSVDDSVVKVIGNEPMVIRRSRGYAPLSVSVKHTDKSVLALGGHLKNTLALTVKNHIFMSQHIGDLETKESWRAFELAKTTLAQLYEKPIQAIACDLHPDYATARYANDLNAGLHRVQHHHAHIVACMAEHGLDGPVLGLAWDGTGLGSDQTIWGGEFLRCTLKEFTRVGFLKPFDLPGAEKAVVEPRRCALSVLFEMDRNCKDIYADLAPIKNFERNEIDILIRMLERKINCIRTSSMGRLFDAVASLLGCRQKINFEGQGAMSLEYLTVDTNTDECYPFKIPADGTSLVFDWAPILKAVIDDIRSGISKSIISAKFHNSLAEGAVQIAEKVALTDVVLSGGCMQNKYLVERLVRKLARAGFNPYRPNRIPPNDGGLSFGQAVCASQPQ